MPPKLQENSQPNLSMLNEEKGQKYKRNFVNENTQKISFLETSPKGKNEEIEEIPHKSNSNSVTPGSRGDSRVKINRIDGKIIHLCSLKTSNS